MSALVAVALTLWGAEPTPETDLAARRIVDALRATLSALRSGDCVIRSQYSAKYLRPRPDGVQEFHRESRDRYRFDLDHDWLLFEHAEPPQPRMHKLLRNDSESWFVPAWLPDVNMVYIHPREHWPRTLDLYHCDIQYYALCTIMLQRMAEGAAANRASWERLLDRGARRLGDSPDGKPVLYFAPDGKTESLELLVDPALAYAPVLLKVWGKDRRRPEGYLSELVESTWEAQAGIFVPVRVRREMHIPDDSDAWETAELSWESVNPQFDARDFQRDILDLSPGDIVTDDRLSPPAIVEYVAKTPLSTPQPLISHPLPAPPEPRPSTGRLLIIALNGFVVATVVLLLAFRRRTGDKSGPR